MNDDTAKFLGLIHRHLLRGVERPVPEHTSLVINEHNYAYFSTLGKVDAMNYSTAVFLINDDVRGLYVTYAPDRADNRERRYLVKTLDQTIEVGDYVVVPSTIDDRFNLAIARVTDTDPDIDFDSTTVVPWVVQRIDMADFNQTIELEEVAIQKIKEADLAKRKRNLAASLMSAAKLKALPLAKIKPEEDEDEAEGGIIEEVRRSVSRD